MIERTYLRLHDLLVRRPSLVLLLVGLVVGGSLPLLLQVRLDMSFRPLFADDAGDTAATQEFESVFGQASGAHIGVIIEHPGVLSSSFLHELSLLSAEVEALDHVTEVLSLARIAVPIWTEAGARGAWAIPPEALQPGGAGVTESQLQWLRQDPGVRRTLLSEDETKTLLLARLDLPLDDLTGRSEVIREFRHAVTGRFGESAGLHYVGVSVVEGEYARIVLHSLARSFLLTVLALLAVLWLIFRRLALVTIAMAGVSLATPLSLGLLTAFGQDLTMINSMVPVMILIIGVADAIHMLQSFLLQLRAGKEKAAAIRGMYAEMALPCLLTTVTTVVGFLSLRIAHITAIRDFGLNVAVGIAVVYLLNLLLIPVLLRLFPVERLVPAGRGEVWSTRWSRGIAATVIRAPGRVVLLSVLLIGVGGTAIPRLDVDQRFNEEVAPTHPVRADQALLEREFGGFLGPEISLQRLDGTSVANEESLRRLRAFREDAGQIADVQRVESILDLLPEEVSGGQAGSGLRQLRQDPLLGQRARELINAETDRTAVVVRTADIGTRRALELGHSLQRLADEHFGPQFEVRIVGQWWLAQRGMDNIVRDMLASFGTSCILILPLVALMLRTPRLILVSILPNLLPMFFALAFMAWTGISLRLGTAMILAIALAIAIDDTVHLLARLKTEIREHPTPEAAVHATLEKTGTAIIYTTVVLVLGFLSMLSNDLLAIRDMGIVAAATLLVALLTDLYLAPALFLLLARRKPVSVRTPWPLHAGHPTIDPAVAEVPANVNRSVVNP